MDVDTRKSINSLISSAKAEAVKGDYSVYNYYKSYLNCMDLNPYEYQDAVRSLADALKV